MYVISLLRAEKGLKHRSGFIAVFFQVFGIYVIISKIGLYIFYGSLVIHMPFALVSGSSERIAYQLLVGGRNISVILIYVLIVIAFR